MTSRTTGSNRFRVRKLSTKQSLAVLRENQIDSVDDDGQRNIPQIETGVERQEEIVRCRPPFFFLLLLDPLSLAIFGRTRASQTTAKKKRKKKETPTLVL